MPLDRLEIRMSQLFVNLLRWSKLPQGNLLLRRYGHEVTTNVLGEAHFSATLDVRPPARLKGGRSEIEVLMAGWRATACSHWLFSVGGHGFLRNAPDSQSAAEILSAKGYGRFAESTSQ